jgi:hypothetical protein
MRPVFLIPVIVTFVVVHFLKTVTGDALSAVILALTIMLTLGSWFAAPLASSRKMRRS